MADHSIQGKTVLIAGGAKNLGGLIARDLAAHGAGAVAIHYNSASSKPHADKTVAAVQPAGARAVAFQADLTRAAAVEKLFADTISAVGRPDIAINTVGKVLKKPMVEISDGKDEGLKVTAEKVQKRTITEIVNASGKNYPEIEVKISPDISGEITELNVQEGDSVKKGQVLARIYADIYNIQRNQAASGVEQTQAQVANSQAAIDALKAQRTGTAHI